MRLKKARDRGGGNEVIDVGNKVREGQESVGLGYGVEQPIKYTVLAQKHLFSYNTLNFSGHLTATKINVKNPSKGLTTGNGYFFPMKLSE